MKERNPVLTKAEALFFAAACQYEVIALLFGPKIKERWGIDLPSITRWSADNAIKSTLVKGGIDYHYHNHRKEL